jgi:hypothetical protein
VFDGGGTMPQPHFHVACTLEGLTDAVPTRQRDCFCGSDSLTGTVTQFNFIVAYIYTVYVCTITTMSPSIRQIHCHVRFLKQSEENS